MKEAILLLVVLNVCHWIGDYTHASRPRMLAAKKFGRPLLPILAHATVHAALMASVVAVILGASSAGLVFLIQLPTHFAIDVAKGRVNEWATSVQNPAAYPHWYVFGADQFAHQLVIILTVSVLSA